MTAFNLSPDDLELIVAALSIMQDIDEDHGREAEAAATRELIDRLQAAQ